MKKNRITVLYYKANTIIRYEATLWYTNTDGADENSLIQLKFL